MLDVLDEDEVLCLTIFLIKNQKWKLKLVVLD